MSNFTVVCVCVLKAAESSLCFPKKCPRKIMQTKTSLLKVPGLSINRVRWASTVIRSSWEWEKNWQNYRVCVFCLHSDSSANKQSIKSFLSQEYDTYINAFIFIDRLIRLRFHSFFSFKCRMDWDLLLLLTFFVQVCRLSWAFPQQLWISPMRVACPQHHFYMRVKSYI